MGLFNQINKTKMNTKEIKQLTSLLNKFLFQYGEEMSTQSGYVNADQLTCDDIFQQINKIKK